MIFKPIFFVIIFSLSAHYVLSQKVKPTAVMVNLKNYTKPTKLRSLSLPAVPQPQQLTTNPISCDCAFGCGGALPVTLLSFDGQRTSNSTVLLNWKTTNEQMNKGFDVERALGNTTIFERVAFVPAKGGYSLQKKYQLQDDNDFSGISYYRLKQIDLDDHFTYSKIIAVKGYVTGPTLEIFPNPVSSSLVAKIYFPKNSYIKLILFDASEKQILIREIAVSQGTNVVTINAANLSGGLYFLKIISTDNDLLTGKFVKQ